jgi:hypothetical protein
MKVIAKKHTFLTKPPVPAFSLMVLTISVTILDFACFAAGHVERFFSITSLKRRFPTNSNNVVEEEINERRKINKSGLPTVVVIFSSSLTNHIPFSRLESSRQEIDMF